MINRRVWENPLVSIWKRLESLKHCVCHFFGPTMTTWCSDSKHKQPQWSCSKTTGMSRKTCLNPMFWIRTKENVAYNGTIWDRTTGRTTVVFVLFFFMCGDRFDSDQTEPNCRTNIKLWEAAIPREHRLLSYTHITSPLPYIWFCALQCLPIVGSCIFAWWRIVERRSKGSPIWIGIKVFISNTTTSKLDSFFPVARF